MGILDDLKSQTGVQDAIDEKELQGQTDQQKNYIENILPKLLQLHSFFTEFSEQLNLIKTPTMVSYPVKPDKGVLEFEQSKYEATVDNVLEPKIIKFSFICSLKKSCFFKIENTEHIERYSDVLSGYRIEFVRTDEKNKNYELVGARFEVVGQMPVNVILQANIETSSIDLILKNFELPGSHKYTYRVDQITEQFIDDLGRYIIRQNPEFMKLDIDEENKEKIRKNIQAEMQRRQQELEESEKLIKLEEEQEAEQKSWKNIFKK